MKGIARTFWMLIALAWLFELFLLILAVRAINDDLSCWTMVTGIHTDSAPACGIAEPIIGHLTWIPAVIILMLVCTSVGNGTFVLCSQLVRTQRKTPRIAMPVFVPVNVSRAAESFGITLVVVVDARAFCFAVGLIAPKVVISTGAIEELADTELMAVLAHESAHVRHRDPARALAVRTAASSLFFFPLARRLSDTALIAVELGADGDAARQVGISSLVSALLVMLGQTRPVPGIVTEMTSYDSIEARVRALQTAQLPRFRASFLVIATSVVAVGGLGLVAAWLPAPVSNVITGHVSKADVHVHPSTYSPLPVQDRIGTSPNR
jgi:Zn-dependent protease with chaperone function